MITLEYDSSFNAIPDGKVEEEFEEIKSCIQCGENYYKIVGNSTLITRVRCGIAEGEINHEAVKFIFNGEKLFPNQYGALDKWPTGYLDLEMNLVERILEAMFQKKSKGD